MVSYDIGFTGKISEWNSVVLEADTTDEAEEFAREYILDTYPEYTDVEIEHIKEIKN